MFVGCVCCFYMYMVLLVFVGVLYECEVCMVWWCVLCVVFCLMFFLFVNYVSRLVFRVPWLCSCVLGFFSGCFV